MHIKKVVGRHRWEKMKRKLEMAEICQVLQLRIGDWKSGTLTIEPHLLDKSWFPTPSHIYRTLGGSDIDDHAIYLGNYYRCKLKSVSDTT